MMEFSQTRGAVPATPGAVDVALEAGVTNERATALIGASWAMAETFTGRNFWPVSAAVVVAELSETSELRWPRWPFPAGVSVEVWTAGAWAGAPSAVYCPEFGTITGLPPGRYRITQTGTLTPPEPAAHVVEAVRALALYQLVHSPARREFRAMTAGDSSLSREALDGLFRASGAGILLAGEVRW